MTFYFSEAEQARLLHARSFAPLTPGGSGNFTLLYQTLSDILGEHASEMGNGGVFWASDPRDVDGQNLKSLKLWVDVAVGANGNIGMHGAFIRTFTSRQGELRLGHGFSEADMQRASNAVAVNFWNELTNNKNKLLNWSIPSISELAQADASAIGVQLYGDLGEDTALAVNAGWAGTIGFSLLGGDYPYETWRLTHAGDKRGGEIVNRLDDVKNILFAVDAYDAAFSAAGATVMITYLNSLLSLLSRNALESHPLPYTDDLRAQLNIAYSSSTISPFIEAVVSRTPIAPYVGMIVDHGKYAILDMLRATFLPGKLIPTKTDSDFAENSVTLFGSMENVRDIGIELMRSFDRLGDEAAHSFSALVALDALSVFRIIGGEGSTTLKGWQSALYARWSQDRQQADVEENGNVTYTDAWRADRATMLRVIAEQDTGTIDKTQNYSVLYTDLGFHLQRRLDNTVNTPADSMLSRATFGTSDSESFDGGLMADRLYGMDGNDKLSGAYGDDLIYGGYGNDSLSGGDGADDLYGDQGTDTLDGGEKDDFLSGGDGDDTLKGGEGADTLVGGDGDDELDGDDDHHGDVLRGAAGNDVYLVDLGDTILDSDGNGKIVLLDKPLPSGKYTIVGPEWHEGSIPQQIYRDDAGNVYQFRVTTLYINDWLEILNFYDGDFGITLPHSGAPDRPAEPDDQPTPPVQPETPEKEPAGSGHPGDGAGSPGAGGTPADNSTPASGTDGNDDIRGNSLGSLHAAGAGDDTLDGGAGDDTLDGGLGNDVLSGGTGRDMILFAPGDGHDVLRADGFMLNDDVVQFGSDVLPSDVRVLIGIGGVILRLDSGDDLFVPVDATLASPLEKIVFADGSERSWANLFAASELQFARGDGQYRLWSLWHLNIGTHKLVFGDGIAPGDISMSLTYGDTIFAIKGTSDAISLPTGRTSWNGIGTVEFADGTTWTWEQVQEMMAEPNVDGDDEIAGTPGDDSFSTGAGNDTVSGEDGNDMLDGGAGDDVLSGGSGNDELYGADGNDQYLGGPGRDRFVDSDGSDTYVYRIGDGGDFIDDSDASGNGQDRIRFGEGIAPADVAVSLMGAGGQELNLSLGHYFNSITVFNWLSGSGQIEFFDFADGTTWTAAQVREQLNRPTESDNYLIGSPLADQISGFGGNDTLSGMQGDDVLVGGPGNDMLDGGAGNDSYHVGLHDGFDSINASDTDAADVDEIVFDDSVAPEDLKVTRDGGSLVINIGRDSDASLYLGGWYDGAAPLVDKVRFANGVEWSASYLDELAKTVTDGDDRLSGTFEGEFLRGLGGDDVLQSWQSHTLFDGGRGNDSISSDGASSFLAGGTGADGLSVTGLNNVVAFNRGDGADSLAMGYFAETTLSLGGGISIADVTISVVYDVALRIDFGTGDSMVINGWYDGDAHRGIERLTLFTEFSPEYAPGSGDLLTNTKVNLFDFRGFVAAFDNARAQNPSLDHWNLAQSALALHLSGGDAQAYGGSLAYEYARTGTSANGMDRVFAQLIGSPDFGSIAQNVVTTTGSPDPILI